VLADWLQVSADELRYGTVLPVFQAENSGADGATLSMQDREMLARYMTLPLKDRQTVSDVVAALKVAAMVKSRQ
jgi:hypothetical protein